MYKSIFTALACFPYINYAFDLNLNQYMPIQFHNHTLLLSKLPSSSHESQLPAANEIVQNLDNFDSDNTNTFNQRYFHISQHYKPGGPIFIYVGNQQRFSDTGEEFEYFLITEIASKLNGHVFFLDHRYYGESIPFQDLTTENLRYLSIDQALADLEHFISYVKSEYASPNDIEHTPVILTGFQYGGSLVTWFRQKYPLLVTGAWASSAPLVAKVDNYEYNEIVGAVYLQISGFECYQHIENGFKAFDQMIANDRSVELSEMLGLCSDMGKNIDASIFLSHFSQVFGVQLQYENKNRLCELLANSNAVDDLGRLIDVFRQIYLIPELECVQFSYDLIIDTYKQSEIESLVVYNGIRQFVYQKCSALGWFPTTNSRYQPFGSGFTTDLFYTICKDAFDDKFDKNIIDQNELDFNSLHGGLQLNVTNVIFTHGEYDPFRVLGVQKDLNEFSPAFVIHGYATSQDVLMNLDSDTQEMKEVKQNIEQIITDWVSQSLSNE